MTQYPVLNFKVNSVPGLGAGSIAVEKYSEKSVCLVFRNGAKCILHTSYIIPKMSRVGFMSGRQDALFIDTGMMVEKKLERQVCKIQFHDDKAAAEAKKTVEGLL